MSKANLQAWVIGGTSVFFLLLILFIARGVFDPRPVGPAQWQTQPDPLLINAHERAVRQLDVPLPAGDFSLRLATTHASGEKDVAYGLAVEELRVGVSPLGYALVSAGETDAFPFQPWPHVTASTNEIWLDVRGADITVRLNRELLWSGAVGFTNQQVGIWGESWGETAVIHFPTLTLYHP